MTKEELTKMGFENIGGRRYRYIGDAFCTTDIFYFDSLSDIHSILDQVFESGRGAGIVQGKKEKSKVVYAVLGIQDDSIE